MKRLPGIVLPFLASAFGCGEIPTAEIGGGGARLLNGQARTPYEAYDMEHNNALRQHVSVRSCLDARYTSLPGATASMESIVRSLETMKALAAPADQPRFDPYLERYRDWSRRLAQRTWGGSFFSEFERSEREIRTQLRPDDVRIVAEFPSAPKPAARETPPPPRDPSAAIPADKVELPASPKGPPLPPAEKPAAAGPAQKPATGPPPAAPPAEEMGRLLYRSWDHAHAELLEAYKGKSPCGQKYKDMTKSLDLLKAQLPRERAERLQVYISCYAGIHERTEGFRVLPDKATEKDVVDELTVVAGWIRRDFNPDR